MTDTRDEAAAELEVTVELAAGYDLASSFVHQRTGRADPTAQLEAHRFVKAARTVEGPVTVELRIDSAARRARARAWGPGAKWTLARAAAWLGANDPYESFSPPRDGKVHQWAKARRGLRMTRSPFPHEIHQSYVLQQRVTWAEAVTAYARLAREFGEDAPGPFGLRLFPDPKTLAGIPRHVYFQMGIDAKRAGALVVAARYGGRLDRMENVPFADVRKFMSAMPGTGGWTRESVMAAGFCDTDAVPPADVHLPHMVSFALAGEPWGSDERMFELLEPYRPHRGRVIRLMFLEAPPRPYEDPGYNWKTQKARRDAMAEAKSGKRRG